MTTSTHTLKNTNKVSSKLYLFQKEMENIDKTLKEKENGRCNKIQVQESIMRGKCINTPHIWCIQREPFS